MPKLILFVLSLLTIILTAFFTLLINVNSSDSVSKEETDTAINQAQLIYRDRKTRGEDFSKGSCLSNALMPDWVLDIAHDPRLPVDDLPENQCPAYLEGRARHFVELDPDGNLIRAK